MSDDDLDAARALLPGTRLDDAVTLSAGERATVRRVHATDGDRERSLIVKSYHGEDEGWLRESAALGSVPGSLRVPRLVAVGAEPKLVITEDLGGGPSVADALLGDDPQAAGDAVIGWATALGELHAATRDSHDAFRAALDARRGDLDVADAWVMSSRIREAERVLDRACGSLGVTIPTGALDELTGLATRLGGDDGLAALTPADACPDNNVRVGDRYVLIDFEGAQWRHIAWDLAYLRVPWPTCWCAWLLPDDVADRAVEQYRSVAVDGFAEVADDGFAGDLDAATTGWALVSASWFLDHALGTDLDSDAQLHPDRPSPTRRQNIMHRLDVAGVCPTLPALAELARNLHAALLHRWGDQVTLDVAPAFRSPST